MAQFFYDNARYSITRIPLFCVSPLCLHHFLVFSLDSSNTCVWMLSPLPRNDVLLSVREDGRMQRNCRRCILIILFQYSNLSFGWKEITGAYPEGSSLKQREDDKSRDYLWIAICMRFDALLIPKWWVNHGRKAEKWRERKQRQRYVIILSLRSRTIGNDSQLGNQFPRRVPRLARIVCLPLRKQTICIWMLFLLPNHSVLFPWMIPVSLLTWKQNQLPMYP